MACYQPLTSAVCVGGWAQEDLEVGPRHCNEEDAWGAGQAATGRQQASWLDGIQARSVSRPPHKAAHLTSRVVATGRAEDPAAAAMSCTGRQDEMGAHEEAERRQSRPLAAATRQPMHRMPNKVGCTQRRTSPQPARCPTWAHKRLDMAGCPFPGTQRLWRWPQRQSRLRACSGRPGRQTGAAGQRVDATEL